jgi:glycosyltransferase involved in cell wall biosynthesis
LIRPEGGNVIWGAEQSFLGLSGELATDGIKITTLEQFPAIRRSRHASFSTYELQIQKLRGMLALIIQTVRVARATKCDFIYAYSMYFKETLIPALLASLVTGKRLVVSINDDKGREIDILSLTDLLRWNFAQGRRISGRITRLMYQLSRRVACRYAFACLSSTNYVADFVRETLHSKRVCTIGRGVDLWWFERTLSEKRYDAIYVGRVDQMKGVEILIKAWKEVVSQMKNAKLLIVGDGYEFQKIKELCKNMKLDDNISFTGYVGDRMTIRKLLASSKIFLFASRKEGFARAVAEAMAVGLPCILTDTSELRSVYGDAAYFARLDDPYSFSEAALMMLQDEKTRLLYAHKSDHLTENFKWEKVSRRVEKALGIEKLG